MGKAKLKKLEEVNHFDFVYQNHNFLQPDLVNSKGESVNFKGNWRKDVFHNNNPLVLELACGKGDYTLAMAEKFPEQNFIGVDVKGDRLWRAALTKEEKNLQNVAFVRTRIEQLDLFFDKKEISEIWITFPDPFPKKGDYKRRLTYVSFLKMYEDLLQKNGKIHLKTDAYSLIESSRENLQEYACVVHEDIEDIYMNPYTNPLLDIKTYYEQMHLKEGRTINYLCFGFKN